MDTLNCKNLNATDTLLRGRSWSRKKFIITLFFSQERKEYKWKESTSLFILKENLIVYCIILKILILRIINNFNLPNVWQLCKKNTYLVIGIRAAKYPGKPRHYLSIST